MRCLTYLSQKRTKVVTLAMTIIVLKCSQYKLKIKLASLILLNKEKRPMIALKLNYYLHPKTSEAF
jgi:hypothetical protein